MLLKGRAARRNAHATAITSVRTENGTYEATDYANKLRRGDNDSAGDGIKLDGGNFALAAATSSPVIVGARAYLGDEQIDADTLIMRDENAGLEDLGRHFSASALEGEVACVYNGKLYVAAIPTDEAVGYRLRVQPLEDDEEPESAVYKVVSGAGATWTEGSNDSLAFVLKRTVDDSVTIDHFGGVEVDGKAIPEKNPQVRQTGP